MPQDDIVWVFPRMVLSITYYWYILSIAMFRISFKDLDKRNIEKPIKTKLLLTPKYPWELGKGLEDPRVDIRSEKLIIFFEE
jgi:predicted GH43/DUF377 family glycosyl hydrolase